MTETTNIKKFPRKGDQLPQNCANTEGYWLNEVLFTNAKMKSVTDLVNGGNRNRRWGFALSMTAIPQFDQVPPDAGPTLLPKTPTRFFAADTVEDLRARVMYEVNKVIDMMKLSVDDPDAYMQMHKDAMAAVQESDDNDMS